MLLKQSAPSLTEQAYSILRRDIITCAIPPGSEISEPELAARLGMSKTPVREALARLGLEGFLETFPRRGYRVSSITLKDVNDLFAVRGLLEPAAASLAAARLTAAELDELHDLAGASYIVGADTTIDDFIGANRLFHDAIAAGSGNARLRGLIQTYLEESERFFFIGARSRDVNMETNRDHATIVEVLRRRDGEQAAAVMREHVENTRLGLTRAILASPSIGVGL